MGRFQIKYFGPESDIFLTFEDEKQSWDEMTK